MYLSSSPFIKTFLFLYKYAHSTLMRTLFYIVLSGSFDTKWGN